MADQNLEALLILQDADLRRKGMENRLALLPKEMDAIIARRDNSMLPPLPPPKR